MEKTACQIESEYRTNVLGLPPMTKNEVYFKLKELGYKLDRSNDCYSNNKIMTGERAGFSYPAINLYIRQIDDGKSFANFESRRDDNFKELQRLRFEGCLYWIHNDKIYEI